MIEGISLSTPTLLILVGVIGFAGFVDALAGGGGLITIPAYLASGVPTPLVLGTNKCVSAAGTALAVRRLLKEYPPDYGLLARYVPAALAGAFLGAMASRILSQQGMLILMLCLVPLLLWLRYQRPKRQGGADATSRAGYHKLVYAGTLIAFGIGTYDGFFGPATGTFLFLCFFYLLHMQVISATVYARVINFTANVAALAYFISVGRVAWGLVPVVLPAALGGYWLGSHLILKGAVKWIQVMVWLVLGALLLKLSIEALI